ncbi:MAG: sugar phosphate isomerase/epimerase family protein [Acidobacteriaceae bacterium]
MSDLGRRTFMQGMLLGAAGVAFGQTPHLRYPSDRRARLAVASYPFRAFIDAPKNSDRDKAKTGMDLLGFAKMVRSEFGLTGIEPLYSHFASTEPHYLHELRKDLDAVGVRTVNIPVDVEVDLCSPDAEKRDSGFESYERWIEAAVVLGSPGVRLHIPRCADPANLGPPAEAFRRVVQSAAARNIIVTLENDDPVLDSASRIIAFIQRVNSPYLRALPDFGNSLMQGDVEFNAKAVAGMFRYAANIAHVKDGEVIHGKLERVDLKQLFDIARAANYRGYYSMESDSDADPYKDTKHLIEASLAFM